MKPKRVQMYLEKSPVGARVFVGGVLFTLGFAPVFAWPLALTVLAGVFWLFKRAQTPRQAAVLFFVFGLGHYISSLHWVPRAFYVDAGDKILPAIIAGVPAWMALSVALSALWAFMAYGAKRFCPKAEVLSLVVLWLGMEALKNVPPLSFPWNPLGNIFAGHVPLMQLASLGSVFLLSLWGLLMAWALSFGLKGGVVAVALLAVQAGYGYYRVETAPTPKYLTTVRLVQANISTAHKWDDAKRRDFLHRHVDLTPTTNPQVTHIFWPETAVAYAVDQDPALRAMLARHLTPNQTLTLGFLRFEPDAQGGLKAYNSAATLQENGALGPIYDKHILVPFGETLPFEALTQNFLRTLSFNRGVYTSGQTPANLPLGGGLSALSLICYEASFPFYVAAQKQNQSVILNLTNDNWFDHTGAPYQHFAMARLRAVETGMPLIRVANTGRSAVVDGYGRVVGELPIQQTIAKNFDIHQEYVETKWIKMYRYFSNL